METYSLVAATERDPQYIIIERADIETIMAALHSLTRYPSARLYGLTFLRVERERVL